MTRTMYFVASCLIAGAVQADQADDLAKALFTGTKGMPVAVQKQIAENLQQKDFSAEKGKVKTSKCGVVPVKTEVKDINGDGKLEALMLIGNECTSGVIGATFYLFTQEEGNKVQRHFGFSASSYELLPAKNDPWPAVLVKGTGACLPVWRYKSGRYGFSHLFEEKKGGCYVPQSDALGG